MISSDAITDGEEQSQISIKSGKTAIASVGDTIADQVRHTERANTGDFFKLLRV